jgi:hypothetical protein
LIFCRRHFETPSRLARVPGDISQAKKSYITRAQEVKGQAERALDFPESHALSAAGATESSRHAAKQVPGTISKEKVPPGTTEETAFVSSTCH